MTQDNYMSSKKIEAVTPHINTFFDTTYFNTLKEIKESPEFIELMDEFLTTDEFTEIMDSFGDENAPTEYAEHIFHLVDNFYNEEKDTDFSYFIKNLISNTTFISRQYGVWHMQQWNDDLTFSKDNLIHELEQLLVTSQDSFIEEKQKAYATNKMKIHSWIDYKHNIKLSAVLATAQCSSLEDLEQLVLNSFDFKSLILG